MSFQSDLKAFSLTCKNTCHSNPTPTCNTVASLEIELEAYKALNQSSLRNALTVAGEKRIKSILAESK